jgi:dTDP-4-dehydrorhamnose 3,5-epimerase
MLCCAAREEPLEVIDLPLDGLKLIRPRIFTDARGYFLEVVHQERYAAALGGVTFVQDNLSFSRRGVLRGLHYQFPRWQGKLVSVVEGEIYDVVVDVRRTSPTFGRWHGQILRGGSHEQLWVPAGFAHGFCATSDTAYVLYKCTDVYDPGGEHTILATDPDIGIAWPVAQPLLSAKDAEGRRLKDAVLP